MATDCSDGIYTLKYTDSTKPSITINKKTLNQSLLDIALLGRTRNEYGDVFDENILHLLENFASDEDPDNPGHPDLNNTYADLLSNPIEGQKWYNKTQNRIFVYDGTTWNSLGFVGDVAGNSGIIAHGQSLPRPISSITGYQFEYSECTWIVSPFAFSDQTETAICETDQNAVVTSQYTVVGFPGTVNSYAFYQILGVRELDTGVQPTPTPSPTLTFTPSPTPGASLSTTPHPTRTPTPTPTHSFTPSITPSVTLTPSITPTFSATAGVTLTPTPSVSQSLAVTILQINGGTFTAAAAPEDINGTWNANGQVILQFNTDGTYSLTSRENESSTMPFNGTWLPTGDDPAQYTIVFAPNITTQTNGTNGSTTITNTAPSTALMNAPNSFIFDSSFTYAGGSIPGGVTGGNIVGTVSITLVNIITSKRLIGTISLHSSAGPI